ncbi:hypothetical protein [Hymenobacter terrestris]|uniref:GAF domain-containing protein n=1 Tax=Hymenobacter terrestris TaxID=2748310 RepID=A0ABX2Q665_9BACT|nr:hypothetical protein [Hymenobacter terrestris]NVO86464.1 hypothetical protein [Hymenobacter terrestris]
MNTTIRNQENSLPAEIAEFTALLQQQGVHAALAYLNYRTPHRYTGVWRFDGDMLRSEALFDRKMAAVRQGADAPMAATYCSLVGRTEAPVQILDATVDPQALGIETPVISYCGALMRDGEGRAFGTLCHYDLQRCQERTTDQPLLAAAAQLLYQHLYASNAHGS